MHLKNKKSCKKLLRMFSLVLCLCMICFTMMGMAYAGDGVLEEESSEDIPADLVETLPVEEEFPVPVETSALLPEPEYSVHVTVPDGWFNTKVELTATIDDVYASGWQKVEAALTDDVFAERTDLTEQLLAENEATYTVRENGTVYFFITDLFGNEHIEEYEVYCFDFDGPIIYAGVSGELLHVETYDLCTAVTGIYVNDMLYTTLENGVLDLWIAGNTWDRQFKVYSVDEIGNCSELLKIANPFYVEPVEETPVPTPDSEEPTHDAHCSADCDCRKQSTSSSSGSPSSSGRSANMGSGSTAAQPAVSSESTASKSQDTAAASEPVSIEKGTGFTENGSAVTRDLLYDKHTNKQFITVETRNGHTLYLVIDYDKPLDEDGEQYETYFLNLVDESDLLALLDEEDTVPVCTCKDKCEAGAVNTSCEVCKHNMTECMGKEAVQPEPEPIADPEPEPEPVKKNSGSGLVLIVLLLALAGGGALYWFKFRKPKADTKGPADLDDYDFGEADDDTEYETEEDESNTPSDSADD